MIRLARFFLQAGQPQKAEVAIEGGDAHHITKVLRLQAGSTIECVDEEGRIHLVRIEKLGATVQGIVLETREDSAESPLPLTLFQAVAKGEKMDFVVQKAVELGAVEIVPFLSERCVVRLRVEQAKAKVQRWKRIAAEAAKQCGRTSLPTVSCVQNFSQVLLNLQERGCRGDLLVVAHEAERHRTLRDFCDKPRAACAVVGPEGGFTESEVEQFVLAGARTISLGPRILRTETAGITLLGLLGYKWGDLG